MPGRRLIRRPSSSSGTSGTSGSSKKNSKPYDPENDVKLMKLLNHIRRKFNHTNIYNAITPNGNARKFNTNTSRTGKNGKTWIVQFAPNSKVVKVIYPKLKVKNKSASLPKMWVLKNNNNKISKTKKYLQKVKDISKLNVGSVNSKNRNLRMKLNSTLHNHAVTKGSKSSDVIKSFFRKKYGKK